MLRPTALAAAIGLALPLAALAQERVVVVELFTSQGCSACPPADAILRELAEMPGVLPLALHVDYWDYIGWTDSFARPEFTERQYSYARAAGDTMVYTPQFVVGGTDRVVGADAMAVMAARATHGALPETVKLSAQREGDRLMIRAERRTWQQPLQVVLVRYLPQETVDILAGENQGHQVTYAQIVLSWEPLGEWRGPDPFEADLALEGPASTAVLLQEPGPGLIHAALTVE